LSSTATLAAVLVALWVAIFGPRRVTKPKLSGTVNLASPDCTWSPSFEERERGAGSALGHYIVRLRIANNGNEDARDVEVMMIRLRVIDDDGNWVMDPSFLPLVLRWSFWTESGPVRWLQRLPPGTFKHCDLLTVNLERDSRSRPKLRRYNKRVGCPKSWMTFKSAHDPSHSSGQSPLRKPPGRYQLDFVVAASNTPAIYQTAHIRFTGWRDSVSEMFSEDGGMNIEITEPAKMG